MLKKIGRRRRPGEMASQKLMSITRDKGDQKNKDTAVSVLNLGGRSSQCGRKSRKAGSLKGGESKASSRKPSSAERPTQAVPS